MKKNCSVFLLYACLAAASAGLLLYPQEVSDAVSAGITLCTDRLLPTLFPFMVLSGFFVGSGAAEIMGSKISFFSRPMFHLPGQCFTAFVIGAVGGYPTGAKTALELYQNGSISKSDAEYTLAFCSNCGPGFLIGTVGSGLFRNQALGCVLYCIQIASAVLTGLLLTPATPSGFAQPPANPTQTKPLSSCFIISVTNALQSLFNLSAFVLCFSAIIRLADLSGIPNYLSAAIPVSAENGKWFFLGLLEMSTGIFHIESGSIAERIILISALTSWSGLSVHCQVLSLLHQSELSAKHYWRGKLLQTALSVLIAAAITGILPRFICVPLIGLLLLSLSKKSMAKSKKVYYNDSSDKQKEPWCYEPVSEENRAQVRLLRTRKGT